MRVGRGSIVLWVVAVCALALPAAATPSPPKPGFCLKPDLGASPDGEVLLAVDRERVRVGATVRVRIENFGTEDVMWGLAYRLARWSPQRGLDRDPSQPHVLLDRLLGRGRPGLSAAPPR